MSHTWSKPIVCSQCNSEWQFNKKLCIKITEDTITLFNGGEMFFIRDQDDNVIEFH